MDRRQRKTREAIFHAFTQLLSQKEFHRITVGQIIQAADVGRATFYSHFETKDSLLKEFCQELFCHIFDAQRQEGHGHKHIFHCEETDAVFLHLFRHLNKNDNNILMLLSCSNNELFLGYFRKNLLELVRQHRELFSDRGREELPQSYWENHIVSTFVETLRWWIANGKKETPEQITEYFFRALGGS